MGKLGWIFTLGCWLYVCGMGWGNEVETRVTAGGNHSHSALTHTNSTCQASCRASCWDWLCYRPLPLPRECRDCGCQPCQSCPPPLWEFFVPQNHYPQRISPVHQETK